MRITRDFFFVDLRKKLNSLTSRFRQVSCPCITIHDEIKLRIICLTKTEGLLSNSLFLMKRTQQKTPRPNRQLIKPWPYRTEPGEICYLKLGKVFFVTHCTAYDGFVGVNFYCQKQILPFLFAFNVWRHSDVTWKLLVLILVDVNRRDRDLYI